MDEVRGQKKKKNLEKRASASTNLMHRLARLAISVPCVPPCLDTPLLWRCTKRHQRPCTHPALTMRMWAHGKPPPSCLQGSQTAGEENQSGTSVAAGAPPHCSLHVKRSGNWVLRGCVIYRVNKKPTLQRELDLKLNWATCLGTNLACAMVWKWGCDREAYIN